MKFGTKTRMNLAARAAQRQAMKQNGGGQTAFNALMGYQGVSSTLSRFRNPNSTNSLTTYTPFRDTLDDLGADNF